MSDDITVYYNGSVQALRYSIQTVYAGRDARPIQPDMLRIVFIREGHCTWVISGTPYPVAAGDVVLLNNTEQRYQTDITPGEPVIQEIIRFTPLAFGDCAECLPIFFDRTQNFSNVFTGDYPQRSRILTLIDWLREEATSRPPLCEASMSALTRQLLICIARAGGQLGMANPPRAAYGSGAHNFQLLCDSVTYIKENITEELSASGLAERAGVSRSYFSRLFHALMGMTIPQYVRGLRISRVRELLRGGGMNTLDAVYAAGFGSVSAYYKALGDLNIDPKSV